MITFKKYRDTLEKLSSQGIQSRTIASLQSSPPGPRDLFLKHDVEARVDRALQMAKIEAETGHRATYYFQADLLAGATTQVKEIAALGHEVTYHYDVLDACDGDYAAAIKDFATNVAAFNALDCPVATVCPHGNPTKVRKGWNSNKDFFRNPDVRALYPDIIDIVVDFPTLFPAGKYISDAGFTLRVIGKIATNDSSNESAMDDGFAISWDDLGRLSQETTGLVVSVHPHRFQNSATALTLQRNGFATLKKVYLVAKKVPFVKNAASRFYKLSRRL